MKNNKLNTLLILSLALFLASCQKEIANSTYDQKEIVKEIGFNMKTVDFNNVAEASKLAPLKFNSLEDAKKYFKPVIAELNKKKDLKSIILNNVLLSDSTLKKRIVQSNSVPVPKDSTVTLNEVIVWSGYTVSFTWSNYGNTSGGGFFSASNFSSGFLGASLGMSWAQGPTSYVNYPNSALIYFTVSGTQNYNLFINGIGTVFSQPVVLNGVYNINTHAYTLNAANPQ